MKKEEDPALCLVCGREVAETDRFIVLVDPRVKPAGTGALIVGAFIGACCVDTFEERGEIFDAEEFFRIMFEEDDDGVT